MLANCKDGLPACDRVGADDRVNSREHVANIVRGAARGGVEFEVIFVGGIVESGLRVGGGQGVEELLIGSGKAVVELVAGSPEGV